MQEVFGSIIGGHQILEALGPSGRFIAFRVKMRGPNTGIGRLYLLSEPLLWPERFHEAVHLVHTRYPFDLGSERALILPEPQLWDARPWFVVPDGARVLGQYGAVTHAVLESLRQQLQWLTELSIARPGVMSGPFAHGDNSRDRILLINDRDARLIAPAWIAATELALQRDLTRAREDDRCLVEQLVEAMQRRSLPPEPVAVESARVDDNEIACQKCGKRNPKQYKFCIGCGASLSMPPARPAAITLSSIPPRALPVPPVLPARRDSSVPPRSRPSLLPATATAPAAATATTPAAATATTPAAATATAPAAATATAPAAATATAPLHVVDAAVVPEKATSTRPSALTQPAQSSPPSAAPLLPEDEPANGDSTASILPSVSAAAVRPSSIPIRGLPEPLALPMARSSGPEAIPSRSTYSLGSKAASTVVSAPDPLAPGPDASAPIANEAVPSAAQRALPTTVLIAPVPVASQTVVSAPNPDVPVPVASQTVVSASGPDASRSDASGPIASSTAASEHGLSSTVVIAPVPVASQTVVSASVPDASRSDGLAHTFAATVASAPDAGVSLERSAQAASEPSRVLASADEQEGAASSSRPSSYPSADHDVQFTIYRPESIPPEVWRKLVVFVHKTRAETPEDPDPVQTVAELAQRVLGEAMAEYQPTHQAAPVAIPHETEISLVPYASGVEFNPREHRFAWLEPVHHSEFRMLARAELDGQTIHGGVRVFIGVLLVADVPLRIEVSSTALEEPHQSVTVGLLRRVFPSYSHADAAIVALCERCAEVLGLHYLRDVLTLRAGEHWSARLAERIREANVFQLFWSTNSMRSPYVRAEWELALELGKRVCPVYWETPFPEAPNQDLPPTALRALHFVDLSGQRHSREITSKDAPDFLAATLHSEAPPASPRTGAGEESPSDANRTRSLSPSYDATPANTPRVAEEEDLEDLAAYLPRHGNWWYVIAFVCIATLVVALLYFVVAAG